MNLAKPKVLLAAHHLNPSWGSEPLIAWRWAQILAPLCELSIVTHTRNRESIESQSANVEAQFHYVDTEKTARRVNRINDKLWPKSAILARSFLESISLRAFDRGAVDVARRLISEGAVDIIHRVSPISPKAASGLGRLGKPFILGPVNGGMTMAPGFVEEARSERESFMKLRSLARVFDFKQSTFRDADLIFAANKTTRNSLPESVRGKTEILCENAVPIAKFEPNFARSQGPLKLLFLGRLMACKGVQHLLTSVAEMTKEEIRLEIVGDGPERANLEGRCRELKVEDRVVFRGAVPVEDVPKIMASADLFALPSVRESGGAVILEAMAAGVPAVAIDHGGPSETITEETGFLVPPRGPEMLVADLVKIFRDLAGDEKKRMGMARAARKHVEKFYGWNYKAERALEAYKRLLSETRRLAS